MPNYASLVPYGEKYVASVGCSLARAFTRVFSRFKLQMWKRPSACASFQCVYNAAFELPRFKIYSNP